MKNIILCALAIVCLLAACSKAPKLPNMGDVYIEGIKLASLDRQVLCGITKVNNKEMRTNSAVPNFDLYIPAGVLRIEGECTVLPDGADKPRQNYTVTFNEFRAKPNEKFIIRAKLRGDAGVNTNASLTGLIVASDNGVAAIAKGVPIH